MKYAFKNKDGRYFQEHYERGKRSWKFTDDLRKAYKERSNTPQYERYIESKFDGLEYERAEI